MKIRNRKGFTLLEVIIVVIIIAILASVALPKLTATIDYAKAKEGIDFIGAARTAIEACGMMHMNTSSGAYNYTNCDCDEGNCLSVIGVDLDGKYFSNFDILGGAASYTITVPNIDGTGNLLYNSVTKKITGDGVFLKISQ